MEEKYTLACTSHSMSGWVVKPVQFASVRHGLNTRLHCINVFIASEIFSAENEIQKYGAW